MQGHGGPRVWVQNNPEQFLVDTKGIIDLGFSILKKILSIPKI